MSSSSPQDELPTRSTTNTQTFLETLDLDAYNKALEEHLVTNPVEQSDLDRCLLRRLQMVQREKKQLSHVAQALTILLQAGAKWNSDALFDDQKTPLHIICDSLGDHHELLDLMVKSSQQSIINKMDIDSHTALMYAVEKANINCIKCLIANEADITIGDDRYQSLASGDDYLLTPIMKAIWMLRCNSEHSSEIMSEIFDLLLDAAVDHNKYHFCSCPDYILSALFVGNVDCINKLIKIGTPLDIIDDYGKYVWVRVARMGDDLELLKNMFNRGIDKDSIDQNGFSILGHAVISGNVKAVRYLLDQGVAIPTYSGAGRKAQCDQCKGNTLIIDDDNRDPGMLAIHDNNLEIFKLLDEYGSQSCKSFNALRCAVICSSVEVVSYLLNKYTYPLNMEYNVKYFGESIFTLLTEPYLPQYPAQITKLLLDHGADPANQMCAATGVTALMAAIYYGHLELIAQYIRGGVDINVRSWDSRYGMLSPFEASVLWHHPYVSVMLLISGCFHKFKVNPNFKLEKLMKDWNVYDKKKKAISLRLRCRSVILNHLSPRADKKIENLPLPGCLIKFLSIPELDNIVYEYNKADGIYFIGTV